MDSLSGPLISLRAPEPGDVDTIFLWENDPALWPYGSTLAPLSRHQIWQYVNDYTGDIFTQRQLRLMVISNATGDAVGMVDLYDLDVRDSHACIGIFIDSRFRRAGYAGEAVALTCGYARMTLAIHQLAAWVSVDNAASTGLFKKAGFKSNACLRSWLKHGREYSDVLVFQKLFE